MARHWQLLIALSLGLSLSVPLYFGGWEALAAFRSLSWWAMGSLLALMGLSWCVQAGRVMFLCHTLGRRIPARSALGITMAGDFAFSATPGGTGSPATYLFLLTRKGLDPNEALALQAVDQSMDLVFFATALPFALMLYALGIGSREVMGIALLVALFVLLGLWLILWLLGHYRKVVLFLGRVINRLPRLHRARYPLARFIVRFRRSVAILVGMGIWKLLVLYLLSVFYWMPRYAVLPVLFFYLGLDADFWFLFLVQFAVLGAGLLTFLPGGGGGVELGYTAVVRTYLDAATGASTLLLWRFVTFYFTLLAGLPVFLYMTGSHAREIIADRGTDARADSG